MNPCSSNHTTEKVACDVHVSTSDMPNVEKPADHCSNNGSFAKCLKTGRKQGNSDSLLAARIRKETFETALKSFKKELKKLHLTK